MLFHDSPLFIKVDPLELQKTNADLLYIYKMIKEEYPYWIYDYNQLHLISFAMKKAFFDQEHMCSNYYQRNRLLMKDIINTYFQAECSI